MNGRLLDGYFSLAELSKELGPEGKPASARTIARYENEPDGLPSVMIAGRKYYRIEGVKAWLAKRERQPNPRRGKGA
jgi:hypothetical protein